ncbi:MAG TPA: hypothetical protein VKM94_20960 [Blastocatellia bacterium]|nr:hypothetical protein [Blastocatellia bacterium]
MQRTPSLRDKLNLRADRLSEEEAQEVLDYISLMQSLRNQKIDLIDEVVATLVFESLVSGNLN